MENNKILVQKEILVEDIKRLIYEVRGTKILLDSDLAKLFGCKNGTKEINQAFKNNMDRFSKSCSWKLTLEEFYELQSKYLTANLSKMSRSTPRVFTEEGVTIISII